MMKAISIILGLALTALGVIPLLDWFGVINLSFTLPISILIYVLAAGGLFVIIDGFFEGGLMGEGWGLMTMLIGVLILVGGILMVLGSFGILPFTVPAVGLIVYNILFIVEGVLLIIAAFNPGVY